MNAIVDINNRRHLVDFSAGVDISIPMRFRGLQPSVFGAPAARATPLEFDEYALSTAMGGSCNVDVITLVPHCNGTHTECVGHIVNDEVSIISILHPGLTTAWLVSITPRLARPTGDSYVPEFEPSDLVITGDDLQSACAEMPPGIGALIIRTLPNGLDKLTRDYDQDPGAFLTLEVVDFVTRSGIGHFLVDVPSIDRANDGGRMENHHRYWGIAPNSRRLPEEGGSNRSITELVYVPDTLHDSLHDGPYLLDLQIPPFTLDAAPSRPVIYKLEDYVS